MSDCEQKPPSIGRPVVEVKRVKIKLRAGIAGFQAEPDMRYGAPISLSTETVRELGTDVQNLLAVQVRDRGMEPMIFEDDWVVIDTKDTARRNGDAYALNWDGEAIIAQLVYRGGQWYSRFLNPDFKPVNLRSAQYNVVGRVIYQPGRLLGGRL